MSFGRPRYHVGEQAGVTITLPNVSKNTISGIQNVCDQAGLPGSLLGIGKGWDVFNAGCTFGPNAQTGDSGGYPVARTDAKVLPSLKPTTDFSVQFVSGQR